MERVKVIVRHQQIGTTTRLKVKKLIILTSGVGVGRHLLNSIILFSHPISFLVGDKEMTDDDRKFVKILYKRYD